jgi:hypothetical protein
MLLILCDLLCLSALADGRSIFPPIDDHRAISCSCHHRQPASRRHVSHKPAPFLSLLSPRRRATRLLARPSHLPAAPHHPLVFSLQYMLCSRSGVSSQLVGYMPLRVLRPCGPLCLIPALWWLCDSATNRYGLVLSFGPRNQSGAHFIVSFLKNLVWMSKFQLKFHIGL